MDIEKLTIAEVKARLAEADEIAAFLGRETPASTALLAEHAYPVGSAVFIRCVTHYYTGRLVRVTPGEIVLTDAAWIADTGRFGEALASGSLNDIEPYPDGEVIVSRGAVVDVSLWHSPLPREIK